MYTKEQALGAIARHTTSHTAQLELLTVTGDEVHRSLLANPALSPEVWDALYQELTSTNIPVSNRDQSAIATLLNSAPTKDRRSLILTQSDLVIVLNALEAGYTEDDSDLIQLIIDSPTFTTQHAAALLASEKLPEPFISPLWKFLDTGDPSRSMTWTHQPRRAPNTPISFHTDLHARALQAMVTSYDLLSDDEVFNFIEKHTPYPQMYLDRIIDYRPALVDKLLNAKWYLDYIGSLSASRYLKDEQAQRLLPMFQKLLDHLPNYDSSPNHIWQLAALSNLLYNPGIPAATRLEAWSLIRKVYNPAARASVHRQVRKLKREAKLEIPPLPTPWGSPLTGKANSAVHTLGTWRYPTLDLYGQLFVQEPANPDEVITPEVVAQVITPTLDKAGPSAWRIFLSLLPNWSQGLDDLLSISLTTAVE